MSAKEFFQHIEVEAPLLFNVCKNIKFNEIIIKHYRRLAEEQKNNKKATQLYRKIESIISCNRWWRIDYFEGQKVKDYLGTFLCKDKFCSNCKKVKQAARMARFIPELEKCSKEYTLYHVVLTVPNVNGDELDTTIKRIFRCFGTLNRYLRGDKKIRGLSFRGWGYLGGLRSLEVTYKGKKYHPHLHCCLVFEKDFLSEKDNTNKFSMKYGKVVRKFSSEEILIQKIWFLLINGIETKVSNIEALKLGYSCMVDKFKESDYAELFKYITKNENGSITYEQFVTLSHALHNKRQIQGYGILRNFSSEDTDDLLESVEQIYEEVRNVLERNEQPKKINETARELLLDRKNVIISRKKLFAYLRDDICVESPKEAIIKQIKDKFSIE